jgi:D-lyxose ketol-isomerase
MDSAWLHIDLSELEERKYKRSMGHKWGYEIELENNELYCGKLLILENGECSSLHYHKDKQETFIVLSGKVRLVYCIPSDCYEPDDDPYIMGICSEYIVGSKITLARKQLHQFWATQYPAIILEVSTHHDDRDTYRVEV